MALSNFTRVLACAALFGSITYLFISEEMKTNAKARLLTEQGLPAMGHVDDAEITSHRAYFIPLYEDAKFKYHFDVDGQGRIDSEASVRPETVRSITVDGEHYDPGHIIALHYLASNPSINLPMSELKDQSTFHLTQMIFRMLTIAFLVFVIDLKWFRPKNTFGDDIMDAEDRRPGQGGAATAPMPKVATRVSGPPSTAARTQAQGAQGSTRPLFGRRT